MEIFSLIQPFSMHLICAGFWKDLKMNKTHFLSFVSSQSSGVKEVSVNPWTEAFELLVIFPRNTSPAAGHYHFPTPG